jgi:hypothetical protein
MSEDAVVDTFDISVKDREWLVFRETQRRVGNVVTDSREVGECRSGLWETIAFGGDLFQCVGSHIVEAEGFNHINQLVATRPSKIL